MRIVVVRKERGVLEVEVPGEHFALDGPFSMYEHDRTAKGNVHETTFKRIDFSPQVYRFGDGTTVRVYFEV